MYNIRDYNAVGNGIALDTKAIQSALDACLSAGGGTVLVPAGVYKTGTIYLRQKCILYLEAGAELSASTDISDYKKIRQPSLWYQDNIAPDGLYGLIIAEDISDAGIEGAGVINGNGVTHVHFPHPDDKLIRRPFSVLFSNCSNMCLKDVKLYNPAFFAFFAISCNHVKIRGVSIFSWKCTNGDGLSFQGSKNVFISDCFFETGDDGISIKTLDPEKPCENFTITNCIFRSKWAGIRLGPESTGDMRNINISNCVFTECNDGLKIQNCSGSVFEDFSFSNLTMRDVRRPVFITLSHFRMSRKDKSIRPQYSRIRRIRIDGLTAIMPSDDPSLGMHSMVCFVLTGLPDMELQDISLTNLDITFPGGGTQIQAERIPVPELLDYTDSYPEAASLNGPLPSAGLYLRHIKGLNISNSRFRITTPDARPVILMKHICDAILLNLSSYGESPCQLNYGLCDNVHVRVCYHNGVNENTSEDLEMRTALAKQLSKTQEIIKNMIRSANDADYAEKSV